MFSVPLICSSSGDATVSAITLGLAPGNCAFTTTVGGTTSGYSEIGSWKTEAQLEERAQRLRESNRLDGVLLTRSEEGMSLFDASGHLHVPAQAREVFDVTGAGDTVIATLAAMLACGVSLREAMPIANRAGGIVVGKFGTATVSYEELFG